MKKTLYIFTILAAVAVLLVGCKKDGVVFTLQTQSYSGDSKAFIDNYNYACWSNGDQVKVNGSTATVNVDISNNRSTATLTEVPSSTSGYYALYPASYCSTTFENGSTIELPGQISYQQSQGKQVLYAPMAAKADANDVMKFTNLCTLFKIHVEPVNNILSSIMIVANTPGVSLCGSASVTFDDAGIPSLGIVSGGNSVTLNLGNGVSLAQGADFYIPLPSIPNGTNLTIMTTDKFGQFVMSQLTASANVPANIIVQVAPPNILPNNNYDFYDYIWSRNSGYIDLGIKPDNTSKFELTFSLTSAKTSQYLTGSRDASEKQWFTLTGPNCSSDGSKNYFQGTFCSNQAQNSVSQGGWNRETGKKYRETMEIKHNSNGYYGEITFENLTDNLLNRLTTGYDAVGITSAAPNVILFGIRPTELHQGMKCFGYRLWSDRDHDGESELIADFVPAKRKSDNAIGFYDMKTGTFILPTRRASDATQFVLGNGAY